MSIVGLLVLAALQKDVAVAIREPRAPTAQSQSFRSECGGRRVEVRAFGLSRPGNVPPQIVVDGADLSARAHGARAFLALPNAVYRFSVQCGQRDRTLLLRMYRAERPGPATSSFHVQTLRIAADGRVVSQEPEATDVEGFWFR